MSKIDFDKTKIYYGLKKRFLLISDKKAFCFYDGWGGQAGKVINLKKYYFWSEMKNAQAWEVDNIYDELQSQMRPYKNKIKKLIQQ